MSNPQEDNRSGPVDVRADAANDRNATLMRLVAEGLRVDEVELQSWRAKVNELYRSASQETRSG